VKKYLFVALVISLYSCKKNDNSSSSNDIVGKWTATSRTVIYSSNSTELSRQSYNTTTAAHNTSLITSFYYQFDASGNFGYYQYNLNTSAYALFEPGDKYTYSGSTLSLSTPSGGASTAVVTFADNNNMMLKETYSGSYTVQTGNTTAIANTETDLTYFTRN
jgi:hypothetical protein